MITFISGVVVGVVLSGLALVAFLFGQSIDPAGPRGRTYQRKGRA